MAIKVFSCAFTVATALALTACLAWPAQCARAEDLTCLKTEIRDRDGQGDAQVDEPPTWYARLQATAHEAFARRMQRFEQLKTAEQIAGYQMDLRSFFIAQLGGLPERTPLNSETVGQIQLDGYRIEKVIFESQPHHHVTANLYLPEDGSEKFPGVVVSSGHSRTAKTADYNQRYGILLARYGMAALCIDPIGQGERSQLLSAEGLPQVAGTTHEHLMMATGSILVGRNTATYRVWDAMRAIDYLQSRPEIMPERIGMVGCSGGGTLTSYVMALDDRVACAAPSCYLTTFGHLIDSIGPQDAEQNIFAQLAFGLDQPDYVLLRAPRPTLISSTTEDFFDIRGSWETFRQSKRIYTRLGAPQRVDLVEAEGKHGVQPANLAATVQWMRRWLLGKDEPVPVEPFSAFKTLPERDLLCTGQGQVLALPGELSVYDLNAERAKALAAQRQSRWAAMDHQQRAAALRKLLGIDPKANAAKPTSNKAGKVERDGYHIDKLVIHTESGVPLPALTFHPEEPGDEAYLYLHDGGKAADGAVGGPIEDLVKKGFVVVSVDLRGQGETANGKPDAALGDWRTFYLAYLLGQSVVGAHAEDISSAADWVANYQTQQPRAVHLVAVGRTAVAALHAAALRDKNPFASITLKDAPRDWTSIASSAAQAGQLTTTVHGALSLLDLPDLVEWIGPEKVKFIASSQQP